jgi:uncharacterized protein YukE
MPTFNATASAVQELIEILPNVASALSTAGSAITKADSFDAEIIDIKNNKLPSLESGLTAVDSKADDIEAKRLQNEFDNAQKFNTWDSKLQREIAERIDDVSDARGLANSAKSVADDALGKAGTALGQAADLFDRVANIFSLIATLATAARMEYLANQLRETDEQLQALINQLRGDLEALDSMISGQLSDIKDILSGYSGDFATLLSRTLALATIQSHTQAILGYVDDLPSTLNTVNNSLDGINGKADLITNYVDDIPALQDSVNSIIPNVPSAVCLALNSGCWNIGDNFPTVDISGLESDVSSVLDKLGTFPYNCSTPQPPDGNYTTVSEALQSLTCGGGNNNYLDDIEDLLDQKDRTDEILDKLDNLPEPTLYTPDEWQIKIEGDRPQLIAGMQESSKAGSGSASNWQIVVPHPRPSVLTMEWETLVEYFPTYNRGSWCAISKLRDGSVVRVRGSSQTVAKNYLLKLLELVDPAYITGYEETFTYTQNNRFKTINVTCRGIAYYDRGRVSGEKPTKRWYYPVDPQV